MVLGLVDRFRLGNQFRLDGSDDWRSTLGWSWRPRPIRCRSGQWLGSMGERERRLVDGWSVD